MAKPMADATGVSFFGRALRPLGAEPTGAEEPAHMVRVVGDPKAGANEFDDPLTGPEGRRIATGFWPAENPADEGSALLAGQPGWAPGGRVASESIASPQPVRPVPAADGSAVDSEPFGDHVRLEPSLQEFNGTDPAAFQFGRTPLWSHSAPPPQGTIGHYLCRNQ